MIVVDNNGGSNLIHNLWHRVLPNLDFTLNKYDMLCNTIARSKYTAMTLVDYLQSANDINRPVIIVRHDIDRSARQALNVARIEYKHNICASYYFRLTRRTYMPDIIDKVASYGHEIGFHYDTIDRCKGDIEQAKELFKKELAKFRNKYPVKTVCAHGNALTENDNKNIWKSLELEDLGLLGEAYLTLDFSKFAYFSDSGRTWLNNKAKKMPGKDYIETAFNDTRAKNTDDIIKIIMEGTLPNICILSHPERWNNGLIPFWERLIIDQAFSWGKVAITWYRNIDK